MSRRRTLTPGQVRQILQAAKKQREPQTAATIAAGTCPRCGGRLSVVEVRAGVKCAACCFPLRSVSIGE